VLNIRSPFMIQQEVA